VKKASPSNPLSTEARQVFDRLVSDFGIQDEAGRLLLGTAMEALDRLREAQALLRADGLIAIDRYGMKKSHPACGIERDARNQLLAALRLLRLEPGEVLRT